MIIGILIYDDVEVLDFAGPFEVFSTANRFLDEKHTVITIALTPNRVVARGGLVVQSDYGLNDHPEIDVLLVPGGAHDEQMDNKTLLTWLTQVSQKTTLVTSVCTGIFLLAQAGIVTNEKVTTHWQDITALKHQFPSLRVQENVRWVDEGTLVSSAGISAGIDMSIYLVSRLYDLALAKTTAKQMQYDWQQ